MIYTLEYIKKEAEGIVAAWDGSSEEFLYEGEKMTEDEVNMAKTLLEHIDNVGVLTSSLGI